MNYKKAVIIFFVLIFVGVGSYICAVGGHYPAIMVGLNIVYKSTINDYYEPTLNYLKAAAATYGGDAQVLGTFGAEQEIRRAIMDKLVEDILVYQEAKKRYGGTLEVEVNKKINSFDKSKLSEAAENIYKLSYEDFLAKEIVPDAWQEILKANMESKGENFEDWIINVKKQAKVFVITSGFYWENGKMQIINR